MSSKDLGSSQGYLQLPQDVQVVLVNDASDPQQAAALAAIFGMVGVHDPIVPVVAVDVEWPCAAWEGSGCAPSASIMQVYNPPADACITL